MACLRIDCPDCPLTWTDCNRRPPRHCPNCGSGDFMAGAGA